MQRAWFQIKLLWQMLHPPDSGGVRHSVCATLVHLWQMDDAIQYTFVCMEAGQQSAVCAGMGHKLGMADAPCTMDRQSSI